QKGQVRTGTVSSIVNFGAFVDLGGVDGLVHVSELSWKHIDHPSEVVEVGQEVTVEVLDVDMDRERVSLSLKATQEDPWQVFARTHALGQIVPGKVTKLVPFGAFVRVEDGIEGLVHISELANRHIDTAEQVVCGWGGPGCSCRWTTPPWQRSAWRSTSTTWPWSRSTCWTGNCSTYTFPSTLAPREQRRVCNRSPRSCVSSPWTLFWPNAASSVWGWRSPDSSTPPPAPSPTRPTWGGRTSSCGSISPTSWPYPNCPCWWTTTPISARS